MSIPPGLYGKTSLDGLAIDQYAQLGADLLSCAYKAMFCPDEAEKKKLWTQFKEEDSPKFYGWFERALKENGTGYMVGSAVGIEEKNDIEVYIDHDDLYYWTPYVVCTNLPTFLETAYFTSKPILSTQNIDKKSQK